MATAIDASYIAASYSLPEPTIQSLLDAPTAEHINALLQKIEEKAREFEDAQAEKLRTDVELETAIRNGNTRANQYKESADQGRKEIEELRRKLAAEETARANLESELQNLKSSSSTSSSEVQTLNSRIASLESRNRDLTELLDTKSTTNDKLAEEMSSQQQKIVSLRHEISQLEAKIQSAENTAMQFKFREQHLQEEVELLKKRDEWNEEELKRRTGEHSKYRKEKTAQVAELQRSLEDVTQSNETLRSTETALRNRSEELNRRLEDAYATIETKDAELIKKDETWKQEVEMSKRLGELHKQAAETARQRQQELDLQLTQKSDQAAAEIGDLQADVMAERKEKVAAETQVQILETELAGLRAQHNAPAAPATPRQAPNGVSARGTPGRPGTPLTPGASRLKAGMTMTQMVSEYSKLKAELDAERRSGQTIRSELDDMIKSLEITAPRVEELNKDNDRLSEDLQETSVLLDQANQARDAARKNARTWESEVKGLRRQTTLLEQQLRDFSTQIKILMVELQAREQGLDNITAAQQAHFEAMARGDLDEAALAGMTDTDRFISERLVVFRNVAELQEQNAKMLNLTRTLSHDMESEEAKEKKGQQEADQKELEELRIKVEEYKDSVQSLTTRSDSYIRERDMFRRMLAHRGQLPPSEDMAEMFGSSIMLATPSRARSPEKSADAKALDEHASLLRELQQHFDAYRQEAATDHAALRKQNNELSREKSDLQVEKARWSSREEVAKERYELLQSNFNMLKSENVELQKRGQVLSENAAKQDIQTQRVAEELVEAKGLLDSARNETKNLIAERDLAKRIEARATEDNNSLREERSRLNKMLSDLQSLQNEQELANSETRRKLQGRIETLESELATSKRKLDEEVEQNKKAVLRRDYESQQNQTRIEDLLKSSANYKEELVAVKTQRDSLQARVDELKIDLRNAEEKTIALQPRLTSRPTPGAPAQENDENALTREQELAVEVADLKRDLEIKEAELQSLKDESEQYKEIAQRAEEELQAMNDASDAYREETDQAITEKDAKIQDLEKRVEEISTELASTTTEFSELRSKHDESSLRLTEQKNIYEAEAARLRDESDRLMETARLHQEDLKAQAQIAQQAQENYEGELVKHAEAASSLQKLRSEHNTLKSEVAGYRAESEAAKLSLSQNEDSWSETRNKYEQEITEIKNSREELKAQNRRLHTQLDELSKQISTLKQNRAAAIAEGDAETTGTPDPASDNTQSIIRWLRQEKEIVDMQYELQIQESKRLQQQLERANSQLEDAREKLEQERRSHTDKEQQATSHSKLMQTINELNLFRESNASLRSEANSAREQLAKKVAEVEDLLSQLEPAKTKAREAELELESKTDELALAEKDRDHWQKRTQDIMHKYDRVDPAELQELRDSITSLTTERDAAVADKAPLQAEVDSIPEKIKAEVDKAEAAFQERRQKIITDAKARYSDQKALTTAAREQVAKLTAELTSAKEELERTKNARDAADQELAQAKVSLNQAQVELQNAKSASGAEEGQVSEPAGEVSDSERAILEAAAAAAEERANLEANRATALQQEIEGANARAESLKAEINTLNDKLAAVNAQLQSSQQNGEAAPAPVQNTEELERLQADLTAAQEEVERLKANPPAALTAGTADLPPASVEEIEKRVAELSAKVQADLNEKFKVRSESMKKTLNEKLVQGRQTAKDEVAAEMKKLQDDLKAAREGGAATSAQSGKSESVAPKSTSAEGEAATNGTAPEGWQPTDAEARRLIQTNVNFQRLFKGNVSMQVKQEKEAMEARAKADRDQAATDATKAAEKRLNMKMTIIQNQKDNLNAQVGIVRQAATDTPQRAVVEVWEIAKVAKAEKASVATGSRMSMASSGALGQSVGSGQSNPAASVTSSDAAVKTDPSVSASSPPPTAPAAPAAANVAQAPKTEATPAGTFGQPSTGTFGQPSQPAAANPFGQPSGLKQPARRASQANIFGAPSGAPAQNNGFSAHVQNMQNQQAAGGAGRGQRAPSMGQQSGIPRSNLPTAPAAQQAAGGGRGGSQLPTAARGGAASGLPRGGGGLRGGAQGGRGGAQQSGIRPPGANRGGAQGGQGRGGQAAAGSPRGGMNPSAKGFVPGNKRPNDGSGGNDEKRQKSAGE